MKRHSSLAPLSREHHGALILARLLQKDAPLYKGLPADLQGKAEYGLAFYEKEMIEHFDAEERILRILNGIDSQLDQMAETILREHQEIHGLFASINDHSDLLNHLDTLGRTLEAHVRKEERQLFPLIQEKCSEETLANIEKALSQNK